MVKDASTSTEVAVLVDGCRMPELEDKDSGPRDWGWLAWDHSAREVASVVSCPNQHQRLIATTTNDYFEILLKNDKRWTYGDGDHAKAALRFVTYVDGHIMEKLLVDPGDESVIEGQDVSSDKRYGIRRMRFAPLRPESSREGAATAARASQAGRIDVIVRAVRSITYEDEDDGYDSFGYPIDSSSEEEDEADMGFKPPPDSSQAATLGNAEKKRLFGLEAAFDDEVAFGAEIKSTRTKCFVDYDQDAVVATFSFRYAAIEGLQISKTNPKAWQDWQWHQIEAARVASRELRKSLRGGFAVTEPPSYLFSSRLSSLEGAGAPRAVGDAAALDAALRGEGFKLAGEASSIFAACSRQLCGTAGLAGYVEHAVVEELVACERFPRKKDWVHGDYEVRMDRDETFEDEYGYLYRSAKSPIKTAKAWLEFVKARRAAHGTLAAGQIYDDDLALSDEPPPLVPGDHVLVRAAKGAELEESPAKGRSKKVARKSTAGKAPRKQLITKAVRASFEVEMDEQDKEDKMLIVPTKEQLVDYEAVVLAAGTTDSEVQVKQVGSSHTETLSRNSKRLGVGVTSRRGAAVAEMQVEMFAQAFSNVFGVMLYLLMVSGQDKNLRVVRVMPRPGRRVLINGVAVAHLGGAFDSIQRHHDIIEIGDESDEDEAPLPAPRKKSRTAKFSKFKKEPGGVKAEVKTERPKAKAPKTKKRRRK